MSSSPLIALQNVSYQVGNTCILDDVSFSLQSQETLTVVGESGSGKSTLARLMMNLNKPTKGEIIYRGKPLAEFCKKHKREFYLNTQMMFQDSYSTFNPNLQVKQILEEPFKLAGEPISETKLCSMLEEVLLSKQMLKLFPHQLSGGQKQRLALARALALKPQLLILDEPTSSLDTITKLSLLALLDRMKREYNLTYFFITHELKMAKLISDRVLVLKSGAIVEGGSSEKIFHDPCHPYTKNLLKSELTL